MSCSARGSCTTDLEGSGREMKVQAINTVGAKPGDRVVLSMNTSSLLKASFFLYVFPILCMISGAVAGQKLAHGSGFSESALSAIAGFAAFFLSFVIVKIVGNRLAKKDEYRPKITRIARLNPKSLS